MKKLGVFGLVAAMLATLMIFAPAYAQTAKKAQAVQKPSSPAVPAAFRFAGWVPYGQVRKYTKKDIANRLERSTELFLQYGFTDLAVHRFRPAVKTKTAPGKEITLEIYRMEKPADAFGIFSVRKSGTDKASGVIKALNGPKSKQGWKLIPKNCGRSRKWKEPAVNRMWWVMIKRQANIFFVIVRRKVQRVAEVFVTTVKRWSQGMNINLITVLLIWRPPWASSY